MVSVLGTSRKACVGDVFSSSANPTNQALQATVHLSFSNTYVSISMAHLLSFFFFFLMRVDVSLWNRAFESRGIRSRQRGYLPHLCMFCRTKLYTTVETLIMHAFRAKLRRRHEHHAVFVQHRHTVLNFLGIYSPHTARSVYFKRAYI
jgi:hypothetical protein